MLDEVGRVGAPNREIQAKTIHKASRRRHLEHMQQHKSVRANRVTRKEEVRQGERVAAWYTVDAEEGEGARGYEATRL